jgi:hypothetical protein
MYTYKPRPSLITHHMHASQHKNWHQLPTYYYYLWPRRESMGMGQHHWGTHAIVVHGTAHTWRLETLLDWYLNISWMSSCQSCRHCKGHKVTAFSRSSSVQTCICVIMIFITHVRTHQRQCTTRKLSLASACKLSSHNFQTNRFVYPLHTCAVEVRALHM